MEGNGIGLSKWCPKHYNNTHDIPPCDAFHSNLLSYFWTITSVKFNVFHIQSPFLWFTLNPLWSGSASTLLKFPSCRRSSPSTFTFPFPLFRDQHLERIKHAAGQNFSDERFVVTYWLWPNGLSRELNEKKKAELRRNFVGKRAIPCPQQNGYVKDLFMCYLLDGVEHFFPRVQITPVQMCVVYRVAQSISKTHRRTSRSRFM